MGASTIYQDIAQRTGGDIYIGVVGPVRTGKSTFIKRFMEQVVLPQMEEGPEKERAKDEMPQSGSGKAVMTTEPKFVPERGVPIQMEGDLGLRVKLIDCVGFPIPEALGLEEDGKSREVHTPWSEAPLPFAQAAALGTKKVMEEHATVSVVITTDGSISDIPREAYLKAEEDVIGDMKETGKPFVILLNSDHPESAETESLAALLSEKYGVGVMPVNCFTLSSRDFSEIIGNLVLEFPIRQVRLSFPSWAECGLLDEILEAWESAVGSDAKSGQILQAVDTLREKAIFEGVEITESDMGKGHLTVKIRLREAEYLRLISEQSGEQIESLGQLLDRFLELSGLEEQHRKLAGALKDVEEKGYGIVTPAISDLTLEEPEIVKHAEGYGVKLKASAPSIHLIRANIEAEISPIVGSERQSEDIVKFLLQEFEEDPAKIWQSNLFGKSLYELVSESLNTKLAHMPEDARTKLSETLQKIINDGSSGLICIIL